jgi:SAM-dependent methyltransferase
MAETSMFDQLASAYAASRPTYPDEAFDAIEELSGRLLSGSRVADVGAGTGISTRQLRGRGASVTAVELSAPMLRQLVAASPGVTAVQGSANALPLADGSVDFVTFAQAWHWVEPELAVPEVLRVLRPGGALACFWNTPVFDALWRTGYNDRIRELLGGDPVYGNSSTGFDQLPRIDLGSRSDLEIRVAEVPWSRRIPIEQRLTNITSRSYISTVDPDRLEEFLAGERAILGDRFPDGIVEEEYSTWVGVVPV